MINYRKVLESQHEIMNKGLTLGGYCHAPNLPTDAQEKIDYNGLTFSFSADTVWIYDDNILLFSFTKGIFFTYKNWFQPNKNMKKFVKSEMKKIQADYEKHLKSENEHIDRKYGK